MEIPFVGGAYKGRSTNLNAQECVNLYPVIDQEGGKSVLSLQGTPGLKEWCDIGTPREVRGFHVMGGSLYALVGNKLYRITSAAVATALSGRTSTVKGHVWTADNGKELMIVAPGSRGYLYKGVGIHPISDADFPTPSSVTFQDGYFIITEHNTGRIYISALYDITSWDALDFATAEGHPDPAFAVMMDHRELWIFGEHSTEVFYNSGDADFPFERMSGGFIEMGIRARDSVAKLDNSIFWLDNRDMVVRAIGYNPVIVSTRQIEYQFSTYSKTNDAVGFAYTQDGHGFYVLTFPRAHKTWVYDVATQLWHERSSRRSSSYVEGKWRGNCYTYFAGKHLVGDYENGKIYELDFDTYTDDGNPLKAVRTASVIHQDRKNIFFNGLEIDFEAGVGITSGQGSDPQAILQWSDDGGHTWSNEHWRGIGKKGKYTARARWNRLGRSRERIFKLTISDPVKRVIIGANLDAQIGVS